jgi:hypothetical protein
LEAALYARYLGYPVSLLERAGIPAASILAKGSEQVGNFGELASTLGVAALRAQHPDWQPPAKSVQLTAAQWHEKYLVLLAESDLIGDVLHLNAEVVAIERRDEDEDVSFQIRCHDALLYEADIVIDTTGRGSRSWFAGVASDEVLGFQNPDPDCYVLGSKSQREDGFTFSQGLEQIRELFAILGERDDLDVYATLPPLE